MSSDLLQDKLEAFVFNSTQNFDKVNGFYHSLTVAYNTRIIFENDAKIYELSKQYPTMYFIANICSWLHGVRDYKYSKRCISEKILDDFIIEIANENGFEPHELLIIIKMIINNISFYKESHSLCDVIVEPYSYILDVVRDANRLDAIGEVGINRAILYAETYGFGVPEDVILYCHKKLMRLYPEEYFKTEYAFFLAKSLHQYVEKYVEKHDDSSYIIVKNENWYGVMSKFLSKFNF